MTPPRFSLNREGRDLVVGDIHGCFSKLQDQLDELKFDGAVDRLFSVGDTIDRGPESADVLDWLAYPWFFPVQGNHEQMAVWNVMGQLPDDMYGVNGGDWLIELQRKSPKHADSIASQLLQLPFVIEVEATQGIVGIVHAACDTLTWPEFLQGFDGDFRALHIENSVWGRDRSTFAQQDIVQGIRAVVVGHTPMMKPTWMGNVLHIDGLAWKNKGANDQRFNIIDLATMEPA